MVYADHFLKEALELGYDPSECYILLISIARKRGKKEEERIWTEKLEENMHRGLERYGYDVMDCQLVSHKNLEINDLIGSLSGIGVLS